MIEDYSIIRLSENHPFKEFETSDSDLTNFLLKDAKIALSDLSAVTYVFESEKRTLAYFSVLNDKITRKDVSGSAWKRIRRKFEVQYNSYPAVKIGRLAVHKDVQGQSLGTKIIDFIRYFFIEKNKTGCRFITVDAYSQSLGFYEKCGFHYFSESDKKLDTRQMYFDLLKIPSDN